MPRQILTPRIRKHWVAIVFFAASLILLFLVSTHSYDPCLDQFKSRPPAVWSGDEPHYLIMVNSLLLDGDLSLANNYQSTRAGGLDAGLLNAGRNFDHHTMIMDRLTGETTLWNNVFSLSPEGCNPPESSCVGFIRISNRFPDYSPINSQFVERPWHAVPFPALLALLLKISRARQDAFEAQSIYSVVFLSWLAGLITYACGLKVGLSPKASLASVSILYFASPWLVYSHELYAMTFLGLLLIVAFWAFLYKQFVIAAILLTIASMQSEAFVVVLAAWTVFLYLSKEKRSALTFASAGIISVIVASLINHFVIGKVSLRHMWFIFSPVLWTAFIERDKGLFMFVPWTAALFTFLVLYLFRRKRDPNRALMAMITGVVPMVVIYALLPDTGGDCYGPRYWVPWLPWFSILFIVFAKRYWNIQPVLIRPILIILVGISIVIAATASIMTPPAVSFWNKPPWYSAGVLLRDGNQIDPRIFCEKGETEFWLGSGCGQTSHTRATLVNPIAVRSTAIIIVSRLACAAQVTDGAEVLRLRIFDANGEVETASFRAGRDSSEWSYDCSQTKLQVRHQRAKIFSSYPAKLYDKACPGHHYVTSLPLSKARNIKKIDFEWIGPGAADLNKLNLTDEMVGTSYAISSSLLRP